MVADTDGTDTGEVTEAESTEKTARKIDQITDSIKSKADMVTPENIHLIQQGVKIAFTVALTALLVYWGIAYYFDVIWFEF